MKKFFIIKNHKVEFISCTAIAKSIGDTIRNKAVFVHDLEDEFSNGDGVIFNVDVPEDVKEAISILQECCDTDYTTLKTVQFNY